MKWEGNLDNPSGYAIFLDHGQECRVPLRCFEDFLSLSNAMDAAYNNGRMGTADQIKRLIRSMFKQNFGELE